MARAVCARAQAIFIRKEISDITLGKLDYFPYAAREKLKKAREDACAIIHAMDEFEHRTVKGGGVEKHPNPYKRMDAEQRNASMMATVKQILADLDKRWPRPSGERSRSEVWQERIKE